jgi:hypothetical protein
MTDFRERMQKLFGQPTFLGERIDKKLNPSALPVSGGREQDRFANAAQVTTYPTRTVTTVFPKGVQQGNPTKFKDEC